MSGSSDYYSLMKNFGLPTWTGMTGDDAKEICNHILAGARVFPLFKEDYQLLRELQVRERWDWPAIFSTNGREIWPFVGNGLTPPELREDVRGMSPVLDEVASVYLSARGPKGGRFFINETGGFWKDWLRSCHQFVVFNHQN